MLTMLADRRSRTAAARPFLPTLPKDGTAMADTWLTIEQAAVTLNLSVRTINRHINAGKLQSRLHEGRGAVPVPLVTPAADVAPSDERETVADRVERAERAEREDRSDK